MKKTLVTLAVMAACGAASAQSSVTLFGIVDTAVTIGRGNVSDFTGLTTSGYNASRLGFRGVEDLGGGLQASFWLEAAVNADTGAGSNTNTNNLASGQPAAGAVAAGSQGLTFSRRSTASLAGGFGEVRLGRDNTPFFWNHTVFDPFGSNGVGIAMSYTGYGAAYGPNAARASNSVAYFLPRSLGGLYGQAQYFLGEQPSGANEDDGNGYGLRLGYAAGPFDVAVAYGNTELAAGDRSTWNVGGSWDVGVAKLLGYYTSVSNGAAGVADTKGWLIGATAPVGVGQIRASYSQTELDGGAKPRARKLALGYVHNLSKRTAIYTTIARVRNDGGAAIAIGGSSVSANNNSTGFDLGVRHSF
ncbi:MAG TPA: porin [Ramlibacter sp.]|nr:porin [Ramlibacter sp.]